MTSAGLAPIAAQLARFVSLEQLLPSDAVEEQLREPPEAEAEEAKLPEDVEPFFGHFCAVIRAAAELLGAPPFARLAQFHDELREQYLPGGPPMSPIYDSFELQFVLGAVPQGIADETPYSVLARLLLRDPSRARLQRMAQSLADARFELYRVKSADGHGAELEPVRGGNAVSVRLTGPFLRTGDFGLMRVLQFEDRLFIGDSPYLLEASEEEWREHLDRVVTRQQGLPQAPTPNPASQLSGKAQARRRQTDKANANRNTPEAIIRRYLKFGLSDRYWFDYFADAYAGERRGIVRLAGVPDRPELLPHATEHQEAAAPQLRPLEEFREASVHFAAKEGLLQRALRDLMDLGKATGALQVDLSPNDQNLLAAYATLGIRSPDGTTALVRFARACERAEPLHPEVRAFVDSVERGWFTVLRVDRIHLDEGLEVFDLFRAEELRLRERTATRQLVLGDLVLGWLCQSPDGTLTFEGGIAHVPAVATEPILSLVAELRRGMPPLAQEQAWKLYVADLPLPLLAGIRALRRRPPPPALAAQLHEVVLAKLRSTLDEPIPQFKGKTLRHLARTAKGRPEAVRWLREQERLLNSSTGLAGLDLRPLWQELGLPFQGGGADVQT